MAYIVNNSRSRLFFTSVAKRDVAEAAAPACPQLERFFMVGLDRPAGPVGAATRMPSAAGRPTMCRRAARGRHAVLVGDHRPAEGHPAAAADVAPAEQLPLDGVAKFLFGFREGMTYLNPAPLYHSAPQASVAATLRLGSTAVIMEHFDAEQWLELVERYRVTHCQMVPTMFSRLLRLPAEVRDRYDVSSLERIVHAAAPCPVPVKQAMIDWLGPIITEYYGATEGNGFTFCDSDEWLAHPGTVGRSIVGRAADPRRERAASARPGRTARSGSGGPPTSSTSTTRSKPPRTAAPTARPAPSATSATSTTRVGST